MKKLEGSKTLQNLTAAFAYESQARNKYDYYSSQAKSDGFEDIAKTLKTISDNEKEHGKIWFKLLKDGMPKTDANLADAAEGEHYEHSKMYPEFAKIAEEEGFIDIATLFNQVAKIEEAHEQKFKSALQKLKDGKVFKGENGTKWECLNSGHIHSGSEPPSKCPVCDHPQSFFKVCPPNQ